MRHRAHGRKLGRTGSHRQAMFRNQLTALFTHERIITTVAKAKDLRPQAERMVTLARTGTLANRRRILRSIADGDVVRKLFDDIAPRFADRPGGYTRIMRLGRRRGDGAELAIIEFVDYVPPEGDEAGGGPAKRSLMDRAKGMFGGGARPADESAEAEAEETDEEIVEEAAAAEESSEAEPDAEPEPEETAEPEPVEAAEEPEEEPVRRTSEEPDPATDAPAAEESVEEQAEAADEDDEKKD